MEVCASPFLSADVHSNRRWCSEDICDEWQESLENEFQGCAASLHVTEKQRIGFHFNFIPVPQHKPSNNSTTCNQEGEQQPSTNNTSEFQSFHKESLFQRSWHIPTQVGPLCSRAEMSCQGSLAGTSLPEDRKNRNSILREAAIFPPKDEFPGCCRTSFPLSQADSFTPSSVQSPFVLHDPSWLPELS